MKETTQIAGNINNSLKETQAIVDQCIEYLKQLADLWGIKIKIPTSTNQPSRLTPTEQRLEATTKFQPHINQQINNSTTIHKSDSTTTYLQPKSATNILELTTDLSRDGDSSRGEGSVVEIDNVAPLVVFNWSLGGDMNRANRDPSRTTINSGSLAVAARPITVEAITRGRDEAEEAKVKLAQPPVSESQDINPIMMAKMA